MNVVPVSDALDQSYRATLEALGAEHGRNAAAWWLQNLDYNPAVLLARIEEGDPETMDTLPRLNLSGEWADGPNVAAVLSEAGIDVDPSSEYGDELVLVAYGDAFHDAAEAAVVEACREALDVD